MAHVFVSYGSDDEAMAGRIFDQLARHYGRDNLSRDPDHFLAGHDINQQVREAIDRSDVLLLLIGENWLRHVRDEDIVYEGIRQALATRKAILPVVLEGARMPSRQDLPSELALLSSIQSLNINRANFQLSVEQLIRAIDNLSERDRESLLRSLFFRRFEPQPSKATKIEAGSIFLSYRRRDTGPLAGRLYDHLVGRFGRQAIVMDVYTFPFGFSFTRTGAKSLRGAKVFVALVGTRWCGKRWLSRSRIFDNDDPIRIEVRAALDNALPIFPALADDATMPTWSQLPDDIAKFSTYNAAQLSSGRGFEHDAEQLMSSISDVL